jgi:hypothetical protein
MLCVCLRFPFIDAKVESAFGLHGFWNQTKKLLSGQAGVTNKQTNKQTNV